MAVTNIMALEPELTPSVTPVVTPTEDKTEVPATTVVEETPQLYKLPDGREVDAAGLKEEYEKLLPEFTRRSQRLAELEGGNKDQDLDNLPEWKRPGYVPKSYAELVELGKQEALAEISRLSEAEEAQKAEVSKMVDATVAAIKAKDPNLDENALFAHANKFGFRDLNLAYENMQTIKNVELAAEQRFKSTQKKPDPIATGGASSGSGAVTPRYTNAGSAAEFLTRLKGTK